MHEMLQKDRDWTLITPDLVSAYWWRLKEYSLAPQRTSTGEL
jgi:hypothetical protein